MTSFPPAPASPAPKGIPKSVWFRLAALAAILVTGFVLVRATPLGEILTEERMAALVSEVRTAWWTPVALVGLFVALAPLGLPMMPLLFAGAIFGPVTGSVYNSLGLVLGAASSYWMAHHLGREFVVHVAGKRLRRAERAFERHGFWPLVQTRFLPLPFAVVNFGAAMSGVKPVRFMTASTLGLMPSTVIQTVFAWLLFTTDGADRAWTVAAYIGIFGIINLLIGIPWFRDQLRRRRRYRELRRKRLVAPRAGG